MPEPIITDLDRALYQLAVLLVDIAVPESRPPPKPKSGLTPGWKRKTLTP